MAVVQSPGDDSHNTTTKRITTPARRRTSWTGSFCHMSRGTTGHSATCRPGWGIPRNDASPIQRRGFRS